MIGTEDSYFWRSVGRRCTSSGSKSIFHIQINIWNIAICADFYFVILVNTPDQGPSTPKFLSQTNILQQFINSVTLTLGLSNGGFHNLETALNVVGKAMAKCLKVKWRKETVRSEVMSSKGTLQRSFQRFIVTYLGARVDIHKHGFKQSPQSNTPCL